MIILINVKKESSSLKIEKVANSEWGLYILWMH